jgi:hypothetical protein
MRRTSAGIMLSVLLGCATHPAETPLDLTRSWQEPIRDSITIEVPPSRPAATDPLTTLPLDSLLGFHLRSAGYKIRMLDDGFVVRRDDTGRLLRFDSLGHRVADVPMSGVTDPGEASLCVGADSALLVTNARAVAGPRGLIWLSLRSDADTVAPPPTELALPPWSLDVSCLRIAGRWVVKSTRLAEPGNFNSRAPIELREVAPGVGAMNRPLFTLSDSSVRLHDSEGNMTMEVSPWSPPLLMAADARGHLYLINGPSGMVRVIDTTASGARLRGITPRPAPLTREIIDSVARARREHELRSAMQRGPMSPADTAAIDRGVQAIRDVTPGVPLPEVDRLLVGSEGSFALASSVWRTGEAGRWDLFDPGGEYLGAVLLPPDARGLGMQHGSLWYLRGADSLPELVRVRPGSAPH